MKNLFVKLYYYFKSEKARKSFFEILFYIVVIALIYILMPGDLTSTVISTMIGFVLSTILLKIIRLLFGSLEDKIKVSGDTNTLLKIYNADSTYKKLVELNGTKNVFIYHEIYKNDGKHELTVVDDKDKYFELTGLIENSYTDLFAIHKQSSKNNEDTIRLDNVLITDDKVIFYTSRSNFYNHLVTNRAIDFKLTENLSLRDIYEHGPYIGSLEKSKFSNHLGINALVFLNDNILLIPRRAGDSTISKKCSTSSIATKLQFPKDGSNHIDAKFLFKDAIIDNLAIRLKIDLDALDLARVHLTFLGIGQNIYEGGKPQAYFSVKLDYSITEFEKILQKEMRQNTIDKDSKIYLARFETMSFFTKDFIRFKALNQIVYKRQNKKLKPLLKYDVKKVKEKEITLGYEKSYMINLWHYFNQ